MSKRKQRNGKPTIEVKPMTSAQADLIRRIAENDPLLSSRIDRSDETFLVGSPYTEDDCPICIAMRQWQN